MASTSSLEFLGCTVSCCSTSCCCTFCTCPDWGCTFAGSGVGGGLCARAVPTVNAPRSADLIIRRMIACIGSSSAYAECPSQCIQTMRGACSHNDPNLDGC